MTDDVKARVLNAVSAIDPIVTNASHRTANFEFPLFISSDKPSWLIDWNNTMIALDTLIKDVESAGTDNTTVIGQIQTKLADLEKIVQTAQNDITSNSNNITDNANNIRELTDSLNTVQNDLISQNSVIKTHTTQIADLQSVDESQNTAIENLKKQIGKSSTGVYVYGIKVKLTPGTTESSSLQIPEYAGNVVNSIITVVARRRTGSQEAYNCGTFYSFCDLNPQARQFIMLDQLGDTGNDTTSVSSITLSFITPEFLGAPANSYITFRIEVMEESERVIKYAVRNVSIPSSINNYNFYCVIKSFV